MNAKWVRMTMLGLLVFCAMGVAAQDMTSINDTPAATLLLPYFEVDLSNGLGTTTVFSINNASATAILAHVTIWSDLSVPVFTFNTYLTGYDVQVIDLRAILASGVLPRTASAGQDPTDTISNKGDFSQDINFASCSGQLPLSTIDAATLTHLQRSLTGQSSPTFGGLCAGVSHGDNIARGYVTVDTVNNCTLRFPDQPGYFIAGGSGDATNQNVMWGDYYFINRVLNQANGSPMVHIHASATDPETSVPGEYTFYGRYVAWTAADNRQPLATNFAARYMLNTLYFPDGTDMIAWRDPKVVQQPFTCSATMGIRPSWYPLGQEGIITFDEQENPYIVQPPPYYPPPPVPAMLPFPAAAQRTVVNSSLFPVAFNRGWVFFNLNQTNPAAGANPPEDPIASQAFVTYVFKNNGRFGAGSRAIAMDSATNAAHFCPGGGCF